MECDTTSAIEIVEHRSKKRNTQWCISKKRKNSLTSVKLPSILAALLSVADFSCPCWAVWPNETSVYSAVRKLYRFPNDSTRVRVENKWVSWVVVIKVTSYSSRSVKKPAAILRDIIRSRLINWWSAVKTSSQPKNGTENNKELFVYRKYELHWIWVITLVSGGWLVLRGCNVSRLRLAVYEVKWKRN